MNKNQGDSIGNGISTCAAGRIQVHGQVLDFALCIHIHIHPCGASARENGLHQMRRECNSNSHCCTKQSAYGRLDLGSVLADTLIGAFERFVAFSAGAGEALRLREDGLLEEAAGEAEACRDDALTEGAPPVVEVT